MTHGEEVLAVAAREIGYHEGKNHHNKYGEWYGLDGVAWCMEFVQWCYHEADFDLPFKTASCGELLRWYKKNQPECVGSEPIPGSVVIFDFPRTQYTTDHTGLFLRMDRETITTIDGNTSSGAGSDANGGYVAQRTRPLSYANPVFIVPRGLEEETMKRYQTLDEIKTDLPWAAPTIEKLIQRGALNGTGQGLDLSEDMIRTLVISDRAGAYGE